MLTVRDATIHLLRDLGMTTIFGNPGSTELPLFRDFPDDFEYVLGLQESVVLSIADGYAQATRNAAIVNLHSSAGTGHALGSLFTAFKNQTPLVVTAGQQARSILPFEPFLYADRPTEFPRPFVKWATEPARACDVPRALARAYYEAMTPPYGPTFVSIPIDDWDMPGEMVEARIVSTINPGDPAALARLIEDLIAAKRPAFVLGAGVARDQASSVIVALAEQQRAAVYMAPLSGRNAFPESHPLFAGFLPTSREALVNTLKGHDMIVAFGGPINLYHVEGSGPHLPDDVCCWSISDNASQLAWAPVGKGILANTRSAGEHILRHAAPQDRSAPSPRPAPPPVDPEKLDDRFVMSTLARLLPDDGVIVEEAPTSKNAMQAYLPLNRPDTYYTTASGGLGFALPAAVGIALGRPATPVVAVLGDGSAMYAIQGLFSAQQANLPVTFIIMNNARYEALQWFGRMFEMDQVVGTNLAGLDFCALAKGHGLSATKVERAQDLAAALETALHEHRPTLIEIILS